MSFATDPSNKQLNTWLDEAVEEIQNLKSEITINQATSSKEVLVMT